MKQKKSRKLLVLSKSTVANLNSGAMQVVLGGMETEEITVCPTYIPFECPTIAGQTCLTRCGTDCFCPTGPTKCEAC